MQSASVCVDTGRRQQWMLYWRARAYQAQGKIELGVENALRGMRIIEGMRAKLLPMDRMKRGFAGVYQQTSDLAIELLFAAKRHGDAFEVAEQSRARAFLDLLATKEQAPFGTRRLADGRLAQLMVMTDEPVLVSRKTGTAANIDRIIATARRLKSTMLAYWTTPSAIYIWVVAPDGKVEAASSKIESAELAKLVKRTQARDFTPDRTAWRRLHGLLIQPAQSRLPQTNGSLLTIP